MSVGGAIAQGLLRGTQAAGLSQLDQLRTAAKQAREDSLAKMTRDYQTSEREAGQAFTGAQNVADRALKTSQFDTTTELTKQGMEDTKEYRGSQLGLQEKQLAEQKRATNLSAATQKELVNLRQKAETKGLEEKARIDLETQEKQVSKLMGDLKELPGYQSANPAVQNTIEMHVRIMGKLPDDLSINADGTTGILVKGNDKLKGASASEVTKVIEHLTATSPSFVRQDPVVQYFQASKLALASANSDIGSIEGVKDIPDDKVVTLAKKVREGKIPIADLTTTYTAEALEKLEAAIGELGDIESKKVSKVVQAQPRGVMRGPIETTRRPEPSGVPGRQAVDALNRVFGGDPMKMYEGDTEVSEAQRRAADIY